MKKQTNLPAASRKLSLNKKTISNLQSSEMDKMVGGNWTQQKCGPGGTRNGNSCYNHNTCNGANTCYTC